MPILNEFSKSDFCKKNAFFYNWHEKSSSSGEQDQDMIGAHPPAPEVEDEVIEDLISSIDRKLRLKSNSCHSLSGKQRRMSPYSIGGSINRAACKVNCMRSPLSDADFKHGINYHYEILQDLLKEGALIKEAVKRLQCSRRQYSYFDYEADGFN